jgi:hypothetical protein
MLVYPVIDSVHSASQEGASRKACLAGNGPALSKRHNAADGPFLARPKGAAPIRQLCVVALGKGLPFPARHARRKYPWGAP